MPRRDHSLRPEREQQGISGNVSDNPFASSSHSREKSLSVLIGSQLIETAQLKRVWLLHGSHTSLDNEVIFLDPYRGIHGDENNVCL